MVDKVLELELNMIRDAFPREEIDALRAQYVEIELEDADGFVSSYVLPQSISENLESPRATFPTAKVFPCLWCNFFTLHYGNLTPFEAKAITMMREVRITCWSEVFNPLGSFSVKPAEVL